MTSTHAYNIYMTPNYCFLQRNNKSLFFIVLYIYIYIYIVNITTWIPLDAAILHCSETCMLAFIVAPFPLQFYLGKHLLFFTPPEQTYQFHVDLFISQLCLFFSKTFTVICKVKYFADYNPSAKSLMHNKKKNSQYRSLGHSTQNGFPT